MSTKNIWQKIALGLGGAVVAAPLISAAGLMVSNVFNHEGKVPDAPLDAQTQSIANALQKHAQKDGEVSVRIFDKDSKQFTQLSVKDPSGQIIKAEMHKDGTFKLSVSKDGVDQKSSFESTPVNNDQGSFRSASMSDLNQLGNGGERNVLAQILKDIASDSNSGGILPEATLGWFQPGRRGEHINVIGTQVPVKKPAGLTPG